MPVSDKENAEEGKDAESSPAESKESAVEVSKPKRGKQKKSAAAAAEREEEPKVSLSSAVASLRADIQVTCA